LNQARSYGGCKCVCNAPTTNLDVASRNLQNIKDRRDAPPHYKVCDTVPHPRIASVEPPRLEKTHFQKCMYMQDVLCSVTWRIV
jgi:hypothetical protein